MNDVVDIEEAEGKVTPRSLLRKLLKNVEHIEQIAVVFVNDNNEVRSGWSNANNLEKIGMLEVAKSDILDDSVVHE